MGMMKGETAQMAIERLEAENRELKAEVERLRNKICVHDQEALDRARDDSGYF